MKENILEKSGDEPRKDEVKFTRHSRAGYKTYAEILASENPQAPFDPEKQITPDITEQGAELARSEAEKFFDGMNPETDALFFASSNEARALDTANIYRQVAHEKGFEILTPEHTRSGVADAIGEGEIRTVKNLSLNNTNTLAGSVFNPKFLTGKENLAALDEETRQKWEEARAIIDADDKGSWGANFYHHSEEIQKIFPELKSAKDLYETNFKNLIRLAEFGMKKAQESEHPKNIKILTFGHENYISYALNKYFGDHEIKYCETITVDVGDETRIERRGEKEVIIS